jgi:hypothetical protein
LLSERVLFYINGFPPFEHSSYVTLPENPFSNLFAMAVDTPTCNLVIFQTPYTAAKVSKTFTTVAKAFMAGYLGI